MVQESEQAERAARIRQLANAGDLGGLDTVLYHLCADINGDWGFDGGRLIQLLQAMPTSTRVQLLDLMTTGLEETAVHQPQQCPGLASLIVLVAEGLSAEQLADWRQPLLALAAGRIALWEGWRLTCLVKVEQAAGRTLPDPVLATVRRTALLAVAPGELVALAADISEPALNPGEPWADRVNADLDGPRPELRPLVAHALTSAAARPTATWQRVGRGLLEQAGPERARRTITTWLALAGEPRSTPLGSMNGLDDITVEADPFNLIALQGLAALLALVPAHPDSAAALGTVVDAALVRVPGIGRRAPKLASAAVHALTQLGDQDARAQLGRLAGTVTYRPTLKILNQALAGHTP